MSTGARRALLPWLGAGARLLLAVVWAWAAVAKMGDPAASVRAVRAYELLPEWLAKGVGYGLPFLEVGLAILLLAGLATRLAAVLSAALLVVFLVGIDLGRGPGSADRVWLLRRRRAARRRPVDRVYR